MFCAECGNELPDVASFCSDCGKATGRPDARVIQRGRIAGHLNLLGIFWLGMGAMHLVPAVIMVWLALAAPTFPPNLPAPAVAVFFVLGGFFSVITIVSIVTGVSLLTREPWGRMLAIVFGGLNLANIPFGTALGIYTLWVMVPEESEREFEQMASAGTRAATS